VSTHRHDHDHHIHEQRNGHDQRNGASHTHEQGLDPEAGVAEMLDLDADVLASYMRELLNWVSAQTSTPVRSIADVGAGTGTGSIALARHFDAATVHSIDASDFMLARLRSATITTGVAGRVHPVRADLDVAWPATGAIDLAWAASSLHHLADPDRVFGDIHAALNPGGVLVVIEMDGFPRFLPDKVGPTDGLGSRIHDIVVDQDWNNYPDWAPHLEDAGFEVTTRTFSVDLSPAPEGTGRYARAVYGRLRPMLDDLLDTADLATLDGLLADERPDSLLRRTDLRVRTTRTAWAAHHR